jgi:hypothetical protein
MTAPAAASWWAGRVPGPQLEKVKAAVRDAVIVSNLVFIVFFCFCFFDEIDACCDYNNVTTISHK